ncbi:MAG: DUF4332 domain-containing protein [Hyphomicrobiaceae bacterium]
MTLLFRVLYAAHAKGTHHKLALDGLQHIERDDADAWRRIFLKHATVYLQGSKAPDDEFKDFKNHVLHVRDDFWGGAPAKARSWYMHLVEALQRQDWQTAVYCAGVLSHYVTDPIQPFHTAQSEAENNIHRAAEWSMSKSYDDLKALAARELPPPALTISSAPNWLEVLICDCATRANQHYEKVIAHYDIHRGVSDPPSGLDVVSRRIIAELLALAAMVHGAVLTRAINEANVPPPDVSLTLESIVATLQIPVKVIAKKLADVEDRRLVERMYDELRATGTVEKNLPEDDRTVRDLHAAEVLAHRATPDAATKFVFHPPPKVETSVERKQRSLAEASAKPAASVPQVLPFRAPVAQIAKHEAKPEPTKSEASVPPVASSGLGRMLKALAEDGPKIYLTLDQDVVDAPSIGPKTAEKLNVAGIDCVDDLLKAHPIALAARLDDRHITEQTITDWQDQARLVCTIPGLRGTGAQLLVGAGYRTAEVMAEAEAAQLCAAVLAFATSSDGQRVLRDGTPPDIEKIKAWADSARRVMAAA